MIFGKIKSGKIRLFYNTLDVFENASASKMTFHIFHNCRMQVK